MKMITLILLENGTGIHHCYLLRTNIRFSFFNVVKCRGVSIKVVNYYIKILHI